MKEVWLIRHGESEANAGLASSDPALIPLTEKGYQQAVKVSTVISMIPSLIVFSPYLRTQQTAQPTMQLFPQAECQEWNIQEFTFLSPILVRIRLGCNAGRWLRNTGKETNLFMFMATVLSHSQISKGGFVTHISG
jgi:broad specificity phosphatase PhoE